MSKVERPTAAFALSLIAGILILINGVLVNLLLTALALDPQEVIPELIPAIPWISAVPGFVWAILSILSLVITVFGIIVLLSAVMLYRNPMSKTTWGALILIFSILSVVGGGGFLIGMILGIIGGALGLAWKPREAT